MNEDEANNVNDDEDLNSDITLKEIKDAIKSYKHNGKSFDNHGFQPEMFQHLNNQSLNLIQKIFNLCLRKKI